VAVAVSGFVVGVEAGVPLEGAEPHPAVIPDIDVNRKAHVMILRILPPSVFLHPFLRGIKKGFS
jgi:hypothetical protein